MPAKVGDYVLIIEAEIPGKPKPPNTHDSPQYWPTMHCTIDVVESKSGKKLKLKKNKTEEIDDTTWKTKLGKNVKVANEKVRKKLVGPLRKIENIGIIRCGPVLSRIIRDLVNP
jgi:hypothetical protein